MGKDNKAKSTSKKGLKLAIKIVSIALAILLVFELATLLISKIAFSSMGVKAAEGAENGNLSVDYSIPEALRAAIDEGYAANSAGVKDAKNVKNTLIVVESPYKSELSFIVMASLNQKTKAVSTYVYQPKLLVYVGADGVEYGTLEDAYTVGGIEGLVGTFEKNFGYKLSKYVAIESAQFAGAIDKLGGVEIKKNDYAIKDAQALEGLNSEIASVAKELSADAKNAKLAESKTVKLGGVQTVAYLEYLKNSRTSGVILSEGAVSYDLLNSMARKTVFSVLPFVSTSLKGAQTNMTSSDFLSVAYAFVYDAAFFEYAASSVSRVTPYGVYEVGEDAFVVGSTNYKENSAAMLENMYKDSDGTALDVHTFIIVLIVALLIALIVLIVLYKKKGGEKEEPKEDPKEEPKEEPKQEPVTEPEEEEITDEEDDDDVKDQIVIEEENEQGIKILVRYKRSFMAKLIQSDDTIKDYYTLIKNYLLSYEKVRSRISWHFDSFNLGRKQLAKINIRGKTLVVYLALDPNEFKDSKYLFEDVSAYAKYAKIPMKLKVKSDRGAKYAIELITIMMEKLGCAKLSEMSEVDYRLPYEPDRPLIQRGLIKVLGSGGDMDEDTEFIKANISELIRDNVAMSEVDLIISDKEADAVTTHKLGTHKGKMTIINIDTLSENFEDGDYIDLAAMKAKGLIPAKYGRVKVLARGYLSKSFKVEADAFSMDAVKMIILTGGEPIKLDSKE